MESESPKKESGHPSQLVGGKEVQNKEGVAP